MFSSRTAPGLFTDGQNNSHELFMFFSSTWEISLDLNRGGTRMVRRGYFRFQSLSILSVVTARVPPQWS